MNLKWGDEMKYFMRILAEMSARYKINSATPIANLPDILNARDWEIMRSAIKYPNGKLVQIWEG